MIPLGPGDVVVAAVAHRDCIMVFTKYGQVYRLAYNNVTDVFTVQRQ